VNSIRGDSVHEIIPDVLDFAYDYKVLQKKIVSNQFALGIFQNYPLTFDGAFTVKFGKMAQIRPRTVEVEHGMDVAVVFHLLVLIGDKRITYFGYCHHFEQKRPKGTFK
jgi:hypothetical protein